TDRVAPLPDAAPESPGVVQERVALVVFPEQDTIAPEEDRLAAGFVEGECGECSRRGTAIGNVPPRFRGRDPFPGVAADFRGIRAAEQDNTVPPRIEHHRVRVANTERGRTL